MDCIVNVESNFIAKQVDECLSLSIRVDGSVDRTHIDKIYILGKIIDKEGKLRTIFMGIGQQTKSGATGLHQTIKDTLETHGSGCYAKCLRKMSSFVTDGASINVGEHKGLWRLLDDDAKLHGATQNILKIWCAAHRSDLTVKDLNKSVEEVPQIIRRLASMASFIRRSHIRVEMLKSIAEANGFEYIHLPRTYEVRWAEFTSNLINAVLRSWNCIVVFLRECALLNGTHDDAIEAESHRRFLTDLETLEMLSFLGDIYIKMTIFQKKLQADDLNIILLNRYVDETVSELKDLHEHTVPAGWEEALTRQLENVADNPNQFLKGIELNVGHANRFNAARQCIQNTRKSFANLRRTILNKLVDSIAVRFSTDEDMYSILNPFVSFDRSSCSINIMRKVHALLAPDIDLALLCSQFNDISGNLQLKKMPNKKLIKHLAEHDSTSSYLEILTVMARLLAATPHSADVERTISANNLLKTDKRTQFKLETENKYLFIYFNMPAVVDWNPERAVAHWINAKHRRVHNLTVENEMIKNKKRRYFKGTFGDSCDDEETEENDEDSLIYQQPKNKKRCF